MDGRIDTLTVGDILVVSSLYFSKRVTWAGADASASRE
jgi:hypothetical protein